LLSFRAESLSTGNGNCKAFGMTGDESDAQPQPPDEEWLPPPEAEVGGDSEWLGPQADAEPPAPAWVPEPPRRDRRVLLRPASSLLCFGAALLTLIGSFTALCTGVFLFGGEPRLSLTITSWEMRAVNAGGLPGGADAADAAGPVPTSGAPLTFAAAVLLVAALVGLFAAAAPGSPGVVRMSEITAAVGAALLLGVVWTVCMEALYWKESFERAGNSGAAPEFSTSFGTGSGFWLLAGAVGLAIGATVLSWLSGRAIRATARTALVREEPETPRFGIPVVVRLPDEPAKPGE
jgi:hypothetical protein